MASMAVHYSSATDDWATPQDFFDRLNREFRFTLDVCATPENAKCPQYFTSDMDGLTKQWHGTVWMNPPYGREIGKWVEKAFTESKEHSATVVCLLPARTDTRWWHRFCAKGDIYFIPGRLKFGDAKTNAPFPSAVVVFRPTVERALA